MRREVTAAQNNKGGNAAEREQGLLFGVIGIVILSPDSLILRLIDCDTAALIALRCIFIALAAGVCVLVSPVLRQGFAWRPTLLYAVAFAGGLVLFPLAIEHTHVANVLVILAVAPLLAAVGSRIFLGEKTATATWVAAAVVSLGVALIFSADFGGGLLGNLFALGTAFELAAGSIIIRRWRQTGFAPAVVLGGALGALAFVGFADWATVDAWDFSLTALNGTFIMTVSFMLIIAASKRLPPAEVNLLFLLETVLGPLWVWLALGEAPPLTTFAAAGLIIPALATHAVWMRRRGVA